VLRLGLARREAAVLLFLTVSFLAGTGVNYLRRVRQVSRRPALAVVAPVTDSGVGSTVRPRLDLNRATMRELEALPGIGPTLARRIVEYREQHGGFASVGQLRQVAGIGPKRYAALKELVTAGHDPELP
jgi:competence protein ComEA